MKKPTGLTCLVLAMLAFAGLGLEVILAFVLEPLLYHAPMQSWTDLQNISHWIITCALWGLLSFGIICFARKRYGYDLFEKKEKPAVWQWIIVAVLVIASLVYSYWDWNGLKIVREFNANGPLQFVFQYVYYCFEVVLVLLISVFGQEAFERWFHNRLIPYGGMLAAVTQGIAHFFTKGSATGIGIMISALAYGCVYLLVNRDIRRTYPIIWLMFVLQADNRDLLRERVFMEREILLLGNPKLYEVSEEVKHEELEELRPVFEDMFDCIRGIGGITDSDVQLLRRKSVCRSV